MSGITREDINATYPLCHSFVTDTTWEALAHAFHKTKAPGAFPDLISSNNAELDLPPFLQALAAVEKTVHALARSAEAFPKHIIQHELNPTLALFELDWEIAHLFVQAPSARRTPPRRAHAWTMVWLDPQDRAVRVEVASDEELLAIKILAEDISPEAAAGAAGVVPGTIDRAISAAVRNGIVLAPPSLIRRDATLLPDGTPDALIAARTFTLQWHITNACDLSCKHCYDRSTRSPLTLDQSLRILGDLRHFCRERHVRGSVCFSGGNPFLHERFFDFYETAAANGFITSVLGNPVPRADIERLLSIQKPGYVQVSLEGLPKHNDSIRGKGSYQRAIAFLETLRHLGISTAVMLTLTKDNMDQVLPLAERLRSHTDHFTFNRLSCVGAGASLRLPEPNAYAAFLRSYVDAARDNPIMGFKDNLINAVLHERGAPLFDGCTGFGCGAAFNFVALLPDGEVHACRKFPSRLGNILAEDLAAIYDGELAERYRRGPAECRSCTLRAVCGSCLSAANSQGIDIFEQRDPFCFFRNP